MLCIVGFKVSINVMVLIVVVIIGGYVVGVVGMFFVLLIVVILKVVFDCIELIKLVGFLMGDNVLKIFSWRSIKLLDLNVGGYM